MADACVDRESSIPYPFAFSPLQYTPLFVLWFRSPGEWYISQEIKPDPVARSVSITPQLTADYNPISDEGPGLRD
jgi:hypothetical protein